MQLTVLSSISLMRRRKEAFLLLAVIWILTGCRASEQQVVTITRPSYEKLTFQTAEVMRGDLMTSMTLKLTAEGYTSIVYRAPGEEFQLEEVYVSVGDRVRKGDILVSFESESIRQLIADYEDGKSQKELLLAHYENLMQADKDADYEADITMLREDIQVAQLYIEEAEMLLSDYQIVAKEDGIITQISEYLQNRVAEPGVELITQVSGTGRYLASASDTEAFAAGEIYPVSDGETEYELRLAVIGDDTLIFQPVAGGMLLSPDGTLTLTLDMPEQKNVVYVNRHAVNTVKGEKGEEDTYCVYVMMDNGYQRAVFVEPGERIGDNIIITEGLDGGEKVVIR